VEHDDGNRGFCQEFAIRRERSEAFSYRGVSDDNEFPRLNACAGGCQAAGIDDCRQYLASHRTLLEFTYAASRANGGQGIHNSLLGMTVALIESFTWILTADRPSLPIDCVNERGIVSVTNERISKDQDNIAAHAAGEKCVITSPLQQ
jgi:hypothetical protein